MFICLRPGMDNESPFPMHVSLVPLTEEHGIPKLWAAATYTAD